MRGEREEKEKGREKEKDKKRQTERDRDKGGGGKERERKNNITSLSTFWSNENGQSSQLKIRHNSYFTAAGGRMEKMAQIRKTYLLSLHFRIEMILT